MAAKGRELRAAGQSPVTASTRAAHVRRGWFDISEDQRRQPGLFTDLLHSGDECYFRVLAVAALGGDFPATGSGKGQESCTLHEEKSKKLGTLRSFPIRI
jgi:hypothetical protein